MRPTSVGTCASKPASWRCVCLHQSTRGRAPGPRALLDYLPRDPALQAAEVRLPGPAAPLGSCFGKPGVFGPRHRGTSSRRLTVHNSGSPAEIVLSNSTKQKKLAQVTCWKSAQFVEDFLTGESPSLLSCKRFAPDDING